MNLDEINILQRLENIYNKLKDKKSTEKLASNIKEEAKQNFDQELERLLEKSKLILED